MASKARRSRRRWSEDFKRRVVAEAAAPGASAAAVARRYDLNANLLFNWKRCYGVSGQFLPVAISEPSPPAPRVGDAPTDSPVSPACSPACSIEITLANGHRIVVRGGVDSATVCRLARSLAEL